VTTVFLVGGFTLLASFLCSLFEAVLYSVTPSQIELLRHRRVQGAQRLAQLRSNIEEPIAGILTINTVAHTVGSTWCGAAIGEELGSNAVGVFAAVFTFLMLTFTEIVPKSFGVRFAPVLGIYCAWPIQLMTWAAWPVARPAQIVMRRLMGDAPSAGPSEAEVIQFSKLAAAHGAVRDEERTWIENALRLDAVTAGDIRTPRTVVETLPLDASLNELGRSNLVHSRIPVTDGKEADCVAGLVYRREVFDAIVAQGDRKRVQDIMHPIGFVPMSMPAHKLLSKFVRERKHIVAVTNEYGGFEGVVTLEDVLECLLGQEIVDEHDEHEDLQQHARERAPGRQEPPE